MCSKSSYLFTKMKWCKSDYPFPKGFGAHSESVTLPDVCRVVVCVVLGALAKLQSHLQCYIALYAQEPMCARTCVSFCFGDDDE